MVAVTAELGRNELEDEKEGWKEGGMLIGNVELGFPPIEEGKKGFGMFSGGLGEL